MAMKEGYSTESIIIMYGMAWSTHYSLVPLANFKLTGWLAHKNIPSFSISFFPVSVDRSWGRNPFSACSISFFVLFGLFSRMNDPNQIKTNQIKSNQIKSIHPTLQNFDITELLTVTCTGTINFGFGFYLILEWCNARMQCNAMQTSSQFQRKILFDDLNLPSFKENKKNEYYTLVANILF